MRLKTTLFLAALAGLASPKRTILIGIDGFLTSCIESAPAFEWLKQNGSFTMKARATIQAVSAPGWSSILCSLDPLDTGIINNDWIPFWKSHKRNKITPITGDDPFPCVFQQIKTQSPEIRTHMYHCWDWLQFLGPGIGYVDVYQEYRHGTLESDTQIKDNTIKAIRSKDFGFIFNYFGSLDEVGHDYGFCNKEYIKRITEIDSLVNEIINELRLQDLLESTTIVLTTDHGATPHTKDHGIPEDSNILVPFIVYGPNVQKGHEIQSVVHIADAAATVLYSLGLKPNPLWRGKPVMEAFNGQQVSSEKE